MLLVMELHREGRISLADRQVLTKIILPIAEREALELKKAA